MTHACSAPDIGQVQEFLVMVANENLPEPVKKVKEHVDDAIAWVTGKGDKGEEVNIFCDASTTCLGW